MLLCLLASHLITAVVAVFAWHKWGGALRRSAQTQTNSAAPPGGSRAVQLAPSPDSSRDAQPPAAPAQLHSPVSPGEAAAAEAEARRRPHAAPAALLEAADRASSSASDAGADPPLLQAAVPSGAAAAEAARKPPEANCAFSYWAATQFWDKMQVVRPGLCAAKGVPLCAAKGVPLGLWETLRTVAGLYLRADVDGICTVVREAGLADRLARYLAMCCQQSQGLKALDLAVTHALTMQAPATPPQSSRASGAPATNEAVDRSSPRSADRPVALCSSMSTPTVARDPPARAAPTMSCVHELLDPADAARGGDPGLQVRGLPPGIRRPARRSATLSARLSDSLELPAAAVEARVGPESGWNRVLPHMSSTKTHNVRLQGLFACLMQELEVLLAEYLGYNWGSMEVVALANRPDTRPDGLICNWPKAADTPSEATSAASLPDVSSMLPSPSATSLASLSVGGSGAPAGAATGPPGTPSEQGEATEGALRAMANWRRAMKAARPHVQAARIDQVMRFLHPKREFKTMQQLLQNLGPAPAARSPDHLPTFLFLGGGMAGGKSTVREIIGSETIWSRVAAHAVVIEADAIKNQDVVFQELLTREGLADDDGSVSQLVHEYSTQKAQGALAAAVNQQRDIIFDGTCSWLPFVKQTIRMVRDHARRYQVGPGYKVNEDGSVSETYWERSELKDDPSALPYHIEMVGVTCDVGLAVARGFWRKLRSGRAVPVRAQLRSHRLFSENWEDYCSLVDSATLYHTGTDLTTLGKAQPQQPRVIAHKSKATRGELLTEPEAYQEFRCQKDLVVEASCTAELYAAPCSCPQRVMRGPKRVEHCSHVLHTALSHAHEQYTVK